MTTTRHVPLALTLALLAGCARKAADEPVRLGSGEATPPAAAPSPPTRPQPHFYNRVVAVCVGIDKYRSVGVPETEGSEADAVEMAKLFREHYAYETVELIRQKATRAEILGHIERVKKELGEKDALIVFFAGHGQVVDLPSFGRAGYLIPYDAELDTSDTSKPKEWAEKAIDMRDLARGVEGCNAQHVLFVIDACFSGFMTRRGTITPAQTELMSQRSRTVLAAATDRQSAGRSGKTGHGHFTGSLLHHLKTDEPVALSDVFPKVRDEVAKNSNRLMLPQRGDFGDAPGEFVFIPTAFRREALKASLDYLSDRARQRSARRTTPDHFYALIDAPNYRFGPKQVELEKEWQARFERFKENSAQGDPLALAALALCYAKGLGTDPDPKEAYRAARVVHDAGRPEGSYLLGYCLMHEIGTPKNFMGAQQLWVKILEAGAPIGAIAISDDLLSRNPSPEVLDMVRTECTKAAKAGLPLAELRIAQSWFYGREVPTAERDRLLPLVKKLAEDGNAVAQFHMFALMVAGSGRGLPDGWGDEARQWLLRSAEQGYPRAQGELAVEYFAHTLPPDAPDALRQFARTVLPLPERVDVVRHRTLATKWADYAARQQSGRSYQVLALLNLTQDPPNFDRARANDREARKLFPNYLPYQRAYNAAFAAASNRGGIKVGRPV